MGVSPTRLWQGCPLAPVLFKFLRKLFLNIARGWRESSLRTSRFLQMISRWPQKARTFSMCWGSVQPSVKWLGWQSAPPSPRSLFSNRKGCLALTGLLEWSTVWNGQVDWCRYAVSILYRWKAKLSIHRPVYAPARTYCHVWEQSHCTFALRGVSWGGLSTSLGRHCRHAWPGGGPEEDPQHSGETMSLDWPGGTSESSQKSWREHLGWGKSGHLCLDYFYLKNESINDEYQNEKIHKERIFIVLKLENIAPFFAIQMKQMSTITYEILTQKLLF